MHPVCQNRSKHRPEIQNVESFNFTNTWVYQQAEILLLSTINHRITGWLGWKRV